MGMDHELNRLMSLGGRYVHKWVNNAIEDVGVQVVGIGEVFYIANPGYGLGAYPLTTAFPRTPFPVRDYDAAEITFNRRMHNNWSLTANMVFSRLYGNYSGLSNSTSESNRNSPNVTRLWDGLFMSFTEKGCPQHLDAVASGASIEGVNCSAGVSNGVITTSRPMHAQAPGHLHAAVGHGGRRDVLGRSTATCRRRRSATRLCRFRSYGPGDMGRHGLLHQHGPELLADVPVQEGYEFHGTVPDPEPVRSGLLDEDDDEHPARLPCVPSERRRHADCRTVLQGVRPGGGTRSPVQLHGLLGDGVLHAAGRWAAEPAVQPRTDQFRGPRTARFYIRFAF